MPEKLVRDHRRIPDRPYVGPAYEDANDRRRADDLDHLISPDERLKIAMTRR
jgi:hypothetical protein